MMGIVLVVMMGIIMEIIMAEGAVHGQLGGGDSDGWWW